MKLPDNEHESARGGGSLSKDGSAGRRLDRQMLNHVEVEIEAVLGYAQSSIGALNELAKDSVLELDRALNEAIELKLNGKVIATGEIVSLDGKFAVRIVDIAG
ncbi:FliM/FliN family flagellar motor switch protein [Novosphingopyxis sp.]|uniref:FliM/FliN family flagellar motor switch protein n=1 Tax=Novosphingopyxis sp. TaxID=2709690 RepID=UPI003B590BF6